MMLDMINDLEKNIEVFNDKNKNYFAKFKREENGLKVKIIDKRKGKVVLPKTIDFGSKSWLQDIRTIENKLKKLSDEE